MDNGLPELFRRMNKSVAPFSPSEDEGVAGSLGAGRFLVSAFSENVCLFSKSTYISAKEWQVVTKEISVRSGK